MLLSRKVFLLALIALLAGASTEASSQTRKIPDEYDRLMGNRGVFAASGNNFFGDSVSLYTGALNIVQTDVEVPGNSSLLMHVGRKFRLGKGSDFPENWEMAHFGDWDLDIPRLHGVFAQADGWIVSHIGSTQFQRCTWFGAPPDTGPQVTWSAAEFWHGSFMYLPDRGDQEMLRGDSRGPYVPQDGKVYPVIVKDGTVLRCVPNLASTSQPGSQGEGFEAVTPEGVVYTFNHMVSQYDTTLEKSSQANLMIRQRAIGSIGSAGVVVTPMEEWSPTLSRIEVSIYPSRVTDRSGNWIVYHWSLVNPWQLSSITASDGRHIEFTYASTTSKRVTAITDGSRSWQYTYNGGSLASIRQPDGRTWSFDMGGLWRSRAKTYQMTCDSLDDVYGGGVGSMTHPSGAVVEFSTTGIALGRSWVPRECWFNGELNEIDGSYALIPSQYPALVISRKKIRGPGLPDAGLQWSYSYGPSNACWDPSSVGGIYSNPGLRCNSASPTIRTVSVNDPYGYTNRYIFGNKFEYDEGQLIRVDEGWDGSVALRTTLNIYADADYSMPTAGPYEREVGDSAQWRGDGLVARRRSPLLRRTVLQQGRSFIWQVATNCAGSPYCFDLFARPTHVIESSGGMP